MTSLAALTRIASVALIGLSLTACAGGSSDPAVPAPVPEPEPTPQPDPQPEPEPIPEPEPDPCPVCCAGDRRCQGQAAFEVCNQDGTGFAATPCPEGEICQQGQCGPPPFSCTPGEATCLDLATLQTCNVDGRSLTTLQCRDAVCIGGACASGALTGAACELNEDCAGGRCLCASTELCPITLDQIIGDGYCTMSDCSATGCPMGEVCADFGHFGGLTEGRHCVKNCVDCDREGFDCRQVPVFDPQAAAVWQDACFPTYPRDMGSKCEADVDCLGGLCWTGDLGPNDNLGYCTQECGQGAACPTGSSCVQFPGLGFFCGLHCGTGAPGSGGCPENRGLSTFCQSLSEFSTNAVKSVCGPRR